jgi:putative flavoprotein involved in K+ transport
MSTDTGLRAHYSVAVIGGGQAGLSMSSRLSAAGIDHVVLEKHRIAHSWRTQRWDSFCLVTPNWQCCLPDFHYRGEQPNGFMLRDEIVAYVEDFGRHINAPVHEGVAVTRLHQDDGQRFHLETTAGPCSADAVVLAVGGYHRPNIPRLAERLPESIVQVHSSGYRNSRQLPQGAVMVVGSGQSGCQIAEDLHLDGRQVHLVVGSAPRSPRAYRGRDATDWLYDMGHYDLPVERHPQGENIRRRANHYMTGRDGGRPIDLRLFAQQGMQLHGRLTEVQAGAMQFRDDLAANLAAADTSYNNICALIDRHIEANGIDAPEGHRYQAAWQPPSAVPTLDPTAAGISAIIWATGFQSDWSWIDLPIFDGRGYPTHRRGVTTLDGVYVLGLPWLHSWGSGRFVGVGRDATYLQQRIQEQLAQAARPMAAAD